MDCQDIHEGITEADEVHPQARHRPEISPRIDPDFISGMMFSNSRRKTGDEADRPASPKPCWLEDNARFKQTQRKFRYGFDKNGKPNS